MAGRGTPHSRRVHRFGLSMEDALSSLERIGSSVVGGDVAVGDALRVLHRWLLPPGASANRSVRSVYQSRRIGCASAGDLGSDGSPGCTLATPSGASERRASGVWAAA